MKQSLPALLALASSLAAQQPARDAARPRTGTAAVSGIVVTEEQNSRPVRGATITLSSSGLRDQWIAATDDAGRFSFTGLPAGNVTLMARKPAYVTTYDGAKRPGSTVGVPIALTEGRAPANITMRLLRGAVITGTVYDEAGRPMQGAPVRIGQATLSSSGERTIAPVSGVPASSADDRGMFRVFGLPPGDYVVSVQPRVTGSGELRQATAAELQWAESQVRSSGSASPSLAAQTPPAPGATMTYANVFYPGTADASAATVVTVTSGQERSGVDIHALFVPTAHVEGTVVDPNGQPAAAVQISLLPHSSPSDLGTAMDLLRLLDLSNVGLLSATSARTNAAGQFVVSGVPPGNYTLMASTASRPAPGGGQPAGAPSAPALWGSTDVEVNGRDVSGVALTLAPGMAVAGRFAFDGKTPPPDQSRVTVTVGAVASGASVMGTVTVATTNPVFAVTGVAPGTYRLSATLPGWTLKSATLRGRNVADVPFEIKAHEDVTDLVVTFTDAPSTITGVLYDGANRPSSDLSIILFSTDRATWYRGSRWLRPAARPASDGRFSFAGLPAGEYYLAAVTEISPAEAADPLFLEQLLPAAIKVIVAPGEKKTQDVKVAGR